MKRTCPLLTVHLILPQVPFDQIKELEKLIREHQLFLDPDCSAALEIITDAYWNSRDFDDGSGAPPLRRDPEQRLNDVEYLQPKVAALFQKKIGVPYDKQLYVKSAYWVRYDS